MYYQINQEGFYLGIKSESNEGMEFFTQVPITGNFVKFKFDGNAWVEGGTPEEISEHQKQLVPLSVSKRQLKQALVLANIPLANIDFAISQIPDTQEKTLMEIFWNDSTEFERNHPKLVEFSQALNICETQADELFILASNL